MNRQTPLPSLFEALSTHARLQPDKTALRDSRRRLSYEQWHTRALRLARSLRRLGLRHGDRVALLAYNRIEWWELYAALAAEGLVAVPVNFRLASPEIAYIAEHSGSAAFVVQQSLMDRVEAIRGDLPIAQDRYIVLRDDTPLTEESLGWVDYEDLIEGAPGDVPLEGAAAEAQAAEDEPAHPVVRPEDLFALMYTSGTTGRPKGAMRSHEGNALIAMATALEFGLSAQDTGLLVMPLCHANSLYFGITFALLGATIVVDDRASFDPAALLRQLARDRITFTSLVPTHYIMMLDLPAELKDGLDLSAVGKLLISSAPARQETKRAIMQLFPNGRLFELYGSTEAGWVTILRPDEQLDHIGSVGREWAGSGAIRLLDEDGQEVPDGEVGELHSRTAYAFSGYWRNPEKTAEAFRGVWCSVGDLARRDERGFIHLVDRKSNMIISGGENIYPSEVESLLAAHPAVQDVAVVGLPDAKWGEAVCAVIVPRPGRSTSAQEMDEWTRPRIAGYKRPKHWVFLEEGAMPRTATGKIQHRLLRERLK